MRAKEIADIISSNEKTMKTIIESLTGKNSNVEHYFGINLNNKGNIEKTYISHNSDFIPIEYFSRKLFPLHTHTSFKIDEPLILEALRLYSEENNDMFSFESKTIYGTCYPSLEDYISHMHANFDEFGIASLYKDKIKIGIYDIRAIYTEKLYPFLLKYNHLTKEINNIPLSNLNNMKEKLNAVKIIARYNNRWKNDKDFIEACSEPYTSYITYDL